MLATTSDQITEHLTIRGIGKCAFRAVPKGTCPFGDRTLELKLFKVPADLIGNSLNVPTNVQEYVRDTLAKMRIDEFPVAGYRRDVVLLIRHSDQPNIGFNWKGEPIALCDIRDGEEYVIDYRSFGNWNRIRS
ncbi:MAG: hypothetical protein P4L81_04450 [Candidatus Pacebacteria bacterium]|nr:hypothetical protein [Candidatus Paceibacterota bacterium]